MGLAMALQFYVYGVDVKKCVSFVDLLTVVFENLYLLGFILQQTVNKLSTKNKAKKT